MRPTARDTLWLLAFIALTWLLAKVADEVTSHTPAQPRTEPPPVPPVNEDLAAQLVRLDGLCCRAFTGHNHRDSGGWVT